MGFGKGMEGRFLFHTGVLPFADVKSVWFRRPVDPVPSPDLDEPSRNFVVSESRALLEGVWPCLDCLWVSRPDRVRAAERKPFQLKTAIELGFKIPPTIITSLPETVTNFSDSHQEIIYKPMSSARILDKDSAKSIFTTRIDSLQPNDLVGLAFAPCLFQEHVEKECDIRVTVIGKLCLTVAIHSQGNADSKVDWRRVGAQELHHEVHRLPEDIEKKCLSLVRILGLEFGAIDFILTKTGEYIFLEINPNGQWAWIQQLCPGIPLRETLADLLLS